MRQISRAENWETVYNAFTSINFAAWDYNTVKRALIDSLKKYYPEDFNDFIESSEFIEIIEAFATVTEMMAYRFDVNANENFLTTASRKESVLRLAKMLSYNPKRNLTGRGLVKINAVSTTEKIFDSRGTNLANKLIKWNDVANQNWKEQFMLVIENVLDQQFGTVPASDRVQLHDTLIEVYGLKTNTIKECAIPYNISVGGVNYGMELVSSMVDMNGPYEKRPEKSQKFNILYLNDGGGDISNKTGFFILTKQGKLQKRSISFDGVTQHQSFTLGVNNVNNTDVWLNNVDENGVIFTGDISATSVRDGEWSVISNVNAENVMFNTSDLRTKFEIETLDNDGINLIFGDGDFADIPNGSFDLWFRTSELNGQAISTSAIQNKLTTFQYRNSVGSTETIKLMFSLVEPINNSAPSDDIDSIKRIARSVYYTQDRMVNGKDYNEYPLQDSNIIKLRAINRTFAGDSKFVFWKDPKEYYENVKIFGDDLVVYKKSTPISINISGVDLPPSDDGANVSLINSLIYDNLYKIFEDIRWFNKCVLMGIPPVNIRKTLTGSEILNVRKAFLNLINNNPDTFWMNYNYETDTWIVLTTDTTPSQWMIRISSTPNTQTLSWEFYFDGLNLAAKSQSTKFNISNNNALVFDYDTQNVVYDNIVLLKANIKSDGTFFDDNRSFRIQSNNIIDVGTNIGLTDTSEVIMLPNDDNGDMLPDVSNLNAIIAPTDFVYFKRDCIDCEWVVAENSTTTIVEYNKNISSGLWKRENGRYDLNFLWMHTSPRYHLVDPSYSNIIDMMVLERGYYNYFLAWLNGEITNPPTPSSPFQLKNTYSEILKNKMISDTVILHPAKIKTIIGKKAISELQCRIKVIRSSNRSLNGNQIKTMIVDAIREYFNIEFWSFGQTFYASEMIAFVHNRLNQHIDSMILVPSNAPNIFGDLYQIYAMEDEILQPDVSVSDIDIVDSLNPRILRQV